ncbi:hypothetical protein [Ruegeria sp. HKCCD4884]|uniref:hypothetical protein n=1 Tax=Ruegeria sp. HKCCD4884 TaxID=2683022 RepID=UPI0020A2D818|nr:hypothetical protein [Ruegeria sp. HKCCD4884]
METEDADPDEAVSCAKAGKERKKMETSAKQRRSGLSIDLLPSITRFLVVFRDHMKNRAGFPEDFAL